MSSVNSMPDIKVLLLEDDEGDAFMLRENLDEDKRNSYTITHVVRLSEALEALGKDGSGFDIILSDLGLPDSQGKETFFRLLDHCNAPIIILTGDEDEEMSIRAIEEGVQDYIVKNNGAVLDN